MKKYVLNFYQLFLAIVFLQVVQSSKVLMVLVAGSKSYKFIFDGIADALLEEGHEVTFISPFSALDHRANLTEVKFENNWNKKMFDTNKFNVTASFYYDVFANMAGDACLDSMQEVEDIITKEYDIVFISLYLAECFLTVPYKQKIPFILVNPNTLMGYFTEIFGAVDFLSFTSNRLTSNFHPMTFFQRLVNLLSILANYPMMDLSIKRMNDRCQERGVCTPDMPTLSEIRLDASFAFSNSVRDLEIPARPMSPSAIYIGGIHIKQPKPLPQILRDFIDGSGENGTILFSLGSAIRLSELPEEHRTTLLKTFASIDYRILWKSEVEEMEGLPPNVMLCKWVPQQDVLAHSKMRLFITHGGLLSTQESTWFGVPVVGIPVFVDQIGNMAEIVSEGWGKSIQLDQLTVESLSEAIQEVIHDDKIRQKLKFRSMLMKTQQNSPSAQVKYWTEYAIRYNGAKHLQSPIARMPWYKIYNMDVWAFILTVFLLITVAFLFIIKKLFCLLCWRNRSNEKKIKSKND